jgi:hypothetical protein
MQESFMKNVAINCSACGEEALLLREPVYEGFTRVGERLLCSACGHEFTDENEVPFKARQQAQVFSDSDRSADVKVFDDNEAGGICRHCANYTVNPFMQWCAFHRKEVEATDSCPQFEKRAEPDETDDVEADDAEAADGGKKRIL